MQPVKQSRSPNDALPGKGIFISWSSTTESVVPTDSLIVGHHMTHVISIWTNNFAIIVVKHHQTGRFEDLLTFERVQ